jgi:hypothetical protein
MNVSSRPKVTALVCFATIVHKARGASSRNPSPMDRSLDVQASQNGSYKMMCMPNVFKEDFN